MYIAVEQEQKKEFRLKCRLLLSEDMTCKCLNLLHCFMPLTTDAYKCNGSGYENFLLSEIHVHAPQKRQNTKSFLLFQKRERGIHLNVSSVYVIFLVVVLNNQKPSKFMIILLCRFFLSLAWTKVICGYFFQRLIDFY